MQFDFNVQANQSQHIDVAGTFVKYKNGTGQIRVRLNGGGYIDLLPGQGVNNVSFNNIDVQDRTGATNVGTILAGIYDFRDDRITGTVDVVDGGKARTVASTACIGYAFMSEVVNGHSHIQLMNPVGSGKNAYVEQVSFFSTGSVSSGIAMRRCDAQLTTLNTMGQKKRLASDPESVLAMRSQADPEQLGTGPYLGALDKVLRCFKFTEPLQLPPGSGLVLINNNLNEDLGVCYEYFEEPI